jgi:hypothetical protein
MVQQLNLLPPDEPQQLFGNSNPQELAALALEQIKQSPGITTEEIATRLGVSYQDMRFAIVRFLKRTGAAVDQGWAVPAALPSPNIEDNNSIRPVTNKSIKPHSSRDELNIKWKSPGGTAKTDSKYPWLYDGDRHLIYIGGGAQSNPIAKSRIEQVEHWIGCGLSTDEIIRRVEELKRGL